MCKWIAVVFGFLFIGLLVGGGSYHFSVVGGKNSEISNRDATIKDMRIEISDLHAKSTELSSENKQLRTNNTDFKKKVDTANAALQAALADRDRATAKWKAATREAAKASETHKTNIVWLESQLTVADDVISQCKAIDGLMDGYLQRRKAVPQ